MPYANVNGFRMYYDDYGAGPAVVLVHGHTFDRRMWAEQVGPLSRAYRVVCPDQRGHGRSESPADGHTLPQFAADLSALIAALGLERPALVGHSMGTASVLGHALAHPDGLRGLVLVSGGVGGDAPLSPRLREYQQKMYDDFLANGKTEAWIAGRTDNLLREGTAHRAEKVELLHSMVRAWSMGSMGYFSPDPPPNLSYDTSRLGDLLRAPALAIIGAQDGGMFHKLADRLVELVPGAQKAVVPEAGHMPQMDNPDFFNEALQGFLAETNGSSKFKVQSST